MVSRGLRSAVLGVALSLGLMACGQSGTPTSTATTAPAATATTVPQWDALVNGVSVTPDASGSFYILTASSRTPGYQASHTVQTGGARSIVLHYDITLHGGPGYIGVLSGDSSHWLGNYELSADKRSAGDPKIDIPGDASVRIVVQTTPRAAHGTKFDLTRVQYDLEH